MSQTKAQLISDLVQALNFTGTSSAPANGMYLSAANTIKLATNSNGRLTIDSSGNAVFTGTCTATGLTVNGDVQFSGAANNVVWDTSDNALEFQDGAKLKIGSDDDIVIHHTGGYSYIEGVLRIGKNNNVRITDANDDTRLQVTNTGAIVTGTCTATTFIGALTGTASGNAVLTGSTNNQIVTVTGANAITGEADLTFDGNSLHHIVGANTHGIKSTAAGDHYTTLEFNSNRSSAGEALSIIDFKWDGDKVADIIAVAGTDTTNKDDGHLTFRTSTAQGNISERLRIKSDGNIGIGTTSPGQKLGVAGNIRFESADPTLEFNNGGGMVYARVANTLQFATGGGPSSPQEKMRIDSSGRLLIADAGTATNTPMETFGSAILQIATSGGASIVLGRNDSSVAVDQGIGNIYFDCNVASGGVWNDVARISCAADGTHADGDYPSRLTFHTTADSAATVSERLRIDSNGYVGIKLTNPHLYYAKDLVVQAISQGGITVKSSSTTDTNYLMFADGTSGNERYRGYIGYAHNTGSDNGEHMQFAASGGTGLMRFYADGLALGGETATANRLNDYEEGTWTPNPLFGSTDAGETVNANGGLYGRYTKIGNLVYCHFSVNFSNRSGSASGQFKLDGLPFAISANNWNEDGGTVHYYSGITSPNSHPTLVCQSTNKVTFIQSNSAMESSNPSTWNDSWDTNEIGTGLIRIRGSLTYHTAA